MKKSLKKSRRKMNKSHPLKVLLKVVLSLLGLVVLLAAGYMGYVVLKYKRIPDNVALAAEFNTEFNSGENVKTNKEYSVLTNNLGFGAYSYDFDFFMDGGTRSWAMSEDDVYENLNGELNKLTSLNPDFMLLQEIDTDSTRSYHINELEFINLLLPGYSYTFAYNYYDSPFFIVPLTEPHGTMNAGLATYSKYTIKEGLRRSLTIMNSFSKFFDLDRCYSITRIPTESGKELVIFNVHLSAYGSDDSVREGQTTMLFNDMLSEYDKGNYVICGGDFNHNLLLAEDTDAEFSSWAYPFPRSSVPEHFALAMDLFGEDFKNNLPMSCRDCDEPYEKGHTTEYIVDGFIVSDNITVTSYDILNTGYLYSDHEPVYMTFFLN